MSSGQKKQRRLSVGRHVPVLGFSRQPAAKEYRVEQAIGVRSLAQISRLEATREGVVELSPGQAEFARNLAAARAAFEQQQKASEP